MLNVAKWSAPYGAGTVGEFVRVPSATASPGDVLLVRLTSLPGDDDPGADGRELPAHVRDLRARFPGCPVAVWIADAPLQVVADAVIDFAGQTVGKINL